ncbi:MAG: hypothetical protein QOF69_3407 [Solirubrobacteraceae bacterium]|nr:hypothetical protein [Solirubrobacteraceae bacterium]
MRVAKFTNASGKWAKVGAAVRHRHGNVVTSPTVVAGPGGKAWLAWIEGTAKSGGQVRVARFSKGKWREVVGGKNPISEAYQLDSSQPRKRFTSATPALAFRSGRPYVAYIDVTIDSFPVVARLSANGRRWQHVSKGLDIPVGVTQPKLANAGGRLFLEYKYRTFNAPVFRRFDAGSSTWEQLAAVQESDSALFGGMVGFGGRLHTLFSESPSGDTFVSKLGTDDKWTHVGLHLATDPTLVPQSIATDGGTLYAAYLQTVSEAKHLTVLFFDGTSWLTLPNPTPAGSTVDSAVLAGAAGGGVWLLAHEKPAGGKAKFQLELFNSAE